MNTVVDPKKQIEDNELRWYTLSVVSGQESMVVENLNERVKKQGLENDIVDYLVPIVPEIHYKKGKKILKERKLYPGYIFVNSRMNEKIWYVIRNTPGVRLIVGAEIHPIPLTDTEYKNIIAQIKEKTERAEYSIPYKEGDLILLKDGEFKGMRGVVTDLDNNRGFLYINIEILGRSTPIMVPFEQVERIEQI